MIVPPRVRKLLVALFRQHGRVMLVLLAFATLQTVVTTAGDPLLMKWLIDSLDAGNLRLFIVIGCSAVAFYTATRVLDYVYAIIKTRVRLAVMSGNMRNSAQLYFRQPYEDIRKHDKGYYHGRILDESKEMAGVLDTAIDIYRAVVGFVSALAVCLWLSWQLALAISAIVPLLLYLARRYSKRISQSSAEVQETEAQLRDTLGQLIGSYRQVNTAPGVQLPHRALDVSLQHNVDARIRVAKHSSLFQAASGISLSYAEMAVLLAAGVAVIAKRITVGGLFSFMSAYWRAVNAIQRLIDLAPQLARLDGVAQRLEEFAQAAIAPVDANAAAAPHGAVRFDGVDLHIGDRSLISGLSLTLERGERLLIVGANGSGKSTLIDMLCGFRAPRSGTVSLPPRGAISCQFTEAGFFPGSVRENLEALAGERVDEWLLRCDLDSVAEQQPYLLSAGQQRKLQIAMALAREVDYYVFDEPLANLDEESKARFFALILRHTQGKTLVAVMHGDSELARHFDKVLDLNRHAVPTVLAPDVDAAVA